MGRVHVRRSILMLAAFVHLVGGAGRAQGAAVIHRYDDLTDVVTLQILVNGSLVGTVSTGGEALTTFLPLTVPTTGPVNLSANIFEALTGGGLGPLSDTFLVTAPAGSTTITESFFSDTEGGSSLTPLVGANVQT